MHVAVVGAGISGLTAAWNLVRHARTPIRITLIEAADRVGGWLSTERKDGFLFEQGPRSFRPSMNGRDAVAMAEDLGLSDQVVAVTGAGKRRFIYVDKTLHELPSSLLEVLRSPLTRPVPLAALREVFVSRSTADDETIRDFIVRRFGVHVADNLIDAVVSGIFAGDISKLSVRSCLPMLWEKEQERGSVVLGMLFGGSGAPRHTDSEFVNKTSKVLSVSFQDGMATLTDTLRDQIEAYPGVSIHTSTTVDAIRRESNGLVSLHLSCGSKILADHVLSTIAAHQLADVLPTSDITTTLRNLPTASVGVANFGYKRDDILSQAGFGYLVPSREKAELLGVSWDSKAFPSQQPGWTRLTAMVGGTHFPQVIAMDEDELVAHASNKLREHLGIDCEPDSTLGRVHLKCIPQYAVNHHKVVASMRQDMAELVPGLTLLGNSFGGVGVADCVARGKEAALQLLQ